MKPDLKSMNRKELEKLKANIDKALARVSKRDMKEAVAAAEKAAKAHGFTLAEITGGGETPAKPKQRRTAKPQKPGVAKFANPDNTSQTWTGKGRRPAWFIAAMQAGLSPDDLAI